MNLDVTMAPKKEHVNNQSPDFGTIGGRLVAERQRVRLSQTDLRIRTGVGKTTQINYESGKSLPDAGYLAELDNLGFDVLYIVTGERSIGALPPVHQNLIEAYEDAPEALKIAVFGMLLTSYYPFRRHIDDAMRIPGFNRYQLAGEEDTRYEAYSQGKSKNTAPDEGPKEE